MSTIFISSTIFDPVKDAQELFETFSEPLIRSKEIAYILCNRSNVQRQAIRKSFQKEYGKDLMEFWKNNDLNDDFLALAEALLTSNAETDAKYLYEAMKGLGTNEKALMEVLFNRSFEEILEIKDAFQRMFKKSLDKEIKSETSGDFYKLLLHILTIPRSNDKSTVNPNKVMEDASNLYKSGEGRKGTDETVFIDILGSRSFVHLRAVFSSYEKQYGKPFHVAAKKETSGDFQDAVLYLISQINGSGEHLAESLIKAMNSKGKRELTRLIASHCEHDLSFALGPFMKLQNQSLGVAIQEKFKDDYGMFLQVLV